MTCKTVAGLTLILALATTAVGQKSSGTVKCAKADQQQTVQIGDKPNHAFSISQSKCTWVKPMEIGGVANTEGVVTSSDEIRGNSAQLRGYFVGTMANGDKGYYRYNGTGTSKDGILQTAEDKWTLVAGTGKLKGLKGQGTCKGKGDADGSVTWECEGTFESPK